MRLWAAYSRNVLINNAKGEYISFFDDDDLSFPNRVSEQMKFLQKIDSKHDVLLFSDRIILNTLTHELTYCKGMNLIHNSHICSLYSLLSCRPLNIESINGSSATCTLTAHVDFLKKIGGFDPHFRRYEDLDISVRTLIYSGHLRSIRQPLIYQQFTPSSSKSISWHYNLDIVHKYASYFPTRNHLKFSSFFIKLKNTPPTDMRFWYYLLSLLFLDPKLFASYSLTFFLRSRAA